MRSTTSNDLVRRPFEGLPNARDLVAMRQLIPAATMAARTTAEHGGVDVVLATILPMAWPAVRRSDGSITVGIQASFPGGEDRKSTRLNSSHVASSYAVFCLKKKTKKKLR